jgi:hypothetical protein
MPQYLTRGEDLGRLKGVNVRAEEVAVWACLRGAATLTISRVPYNVSA